MQIKHKLDQGTVQSRQFAAHDDKTGPGNLACGIAVELSQCGTEFHVVAHLKIEAVGFTPAANLQVVVLGFTGRNRFIRQA